MTPSQIEVGHNAIADLGKAIGRVAVLRSSLPAEIQDQFTAMAIECICDIFASVTALQVIERAKRGQKQRR